MRTKLENEIKEFTINVAENMIKIDLAHSFTVNSPPVSGFCIGQIPDEGEKSTATLFPDIYCIIKNASQIDIIKIF